MGTAFYGIALNADIALHRGKVIRSVIAQDAEQQSIRRKRGRVMTEKEREALMRLTMCAREECGMCKYEDTCDFDFQYELATKNMNILADALIADRKTEPQTDCADTNLSEKPTDSERSE